MATSFLDNAEEYGASNQNIDDEIYSPVRLSNSTRRYGSAQEYRSGLIEDYSPHAQMEQEAAARRLEIDKMEDEAFNREIQRRVNAADWNDKVRAQQQAGEVSQALIDLDPTAPDYQMQVDTILKDNPLAPMNSAISKLLERRGAKYAEAQKERERQMALQDRQQERLEAREDNKQFQMDSARISREENLRNNIDLKVADMSAEGQNTYKRLLDEGKSPMEAFQSARIDDKGVVNLKEANISTRMIQNYDRQISQAQKAMAAIDADLTKSASEKAALKDPFQTQIEGWTVDKSLEQAVLDSYWESKGGRPKPKEDAKPTGAPAPSGKMSVKSLLPGSK